MLVTPPGPAVNWTYILPDGLARDPEVIVMLAPIGAKTVHRTCELTGREFCMMEHRDKITGIQILDEKVKTLVDVELAFNEKGLELSRVHYIGQLSEIPDRLVLLSVATPILILMSEPWRPFINLRRSVRRVTINEDNVN